MKIKLKRIANAKIVLIAIVLICCQQCKTSNNGVIEDETTIKITKGNTVFTIEKEGFKYGIQDLSGKIIAPSHPESGLQLGKGEGDFLNVKSTELVNKTEEYVDLIALIADGSYANIRLTWFDNAIKLSVVPQDLGKYNIALRTGNMGPAYGMGDHAAYGTGAKDLVLNNFVEEPFEAESRGGHRMISNFAIFPQEGLAMINMEPKGKLVRITDKETAQGSLRVEKMSSFYYFIGTPKEIYAAFLNARNIEGYSVYKPKYDWFGVGWEAFGALGWNTNHQTVKDNMDKYLDYGYPLDWMVVGSGFWPSSVGEFDENGSTHSSQTQSEAIKKLQATTSFGMWSKEKYPDPKGFIDYFKQKNLKFIIGLRIAFIPGGPFTDEGLKNDFFIKDSDGKPTLFKPGFPRVPVHLLNTKNKKAVDWYIALCDKWLSYGVDGFKEDLFHHPKSLSDDLIDPVNRVLMDKGIYVMGRNNYLGSPVDIHRYQDFNYNHPQDRGPINGLAYAFSGFPYVYPDIVGGTGLATGRWGSVEDKKKLRVYMIRYAQYAALNPSLAFGYGPWNYDERTNQLCLDAAKLHDRLHPYIYSNAIKAYKTGYPYTMTPLPLAYPKDNNVYNLANTTKRSYEWLIGEALLAAPLYGADYETAKTRDIYLPDGKWMDYDTGETYQGPVTLENFDIPLDKAPLFVGGSGFIVEEIDNKLKGRLYLSTQTETVFYAKDGETKGVIKINNPNLNDLIITNLTTNTKVPYKKVRHALQFDFIAGHNYLIN